MEHLNDGRCVLLVVKRWFSQFFALRVVLVKKGLYIHIHIHIS